ncbi:hypothetical protein C8F04DRAFT_285040 [Mycena alexandri]|uniref:Uncharacterized protein n=1 Tax=Mycena alexandri TaxID=1745969 RepID=A0AAD6S4P8_9AGAR|nr:hypothetical protein C8F04DRAFT_285040 [Mycena alexandri]
MKRRQREEWGEGNASERGGNAQRGTVRGDSFQGAYTADTPSFPCSLTQRSPPYTPTSCAVHATREHRHCFVGRKIGRGTYLVFWRCIPIPVPPFIPRLPHRPPPSFTPPPAALSSHVLHRPLPRLRRRTPAMLPGAVSADSHSAGTHLRTRTYRVRAVCVCTEAPRTPLPCRSSCAGARAEFCADHPPPPRLCANSALPSTHTLSTPLLSSSPFLSPLRVRVLRRMYYVCKF